MSQKRKNRTRKKYRKKINQQFQTPQLPRLLQLSLKTMWFQHHKLLPLRILTKSQPHQTQFLRGKRTKKIVLFTELHFIYCYIYFLHYIMPICENKIYFFFLKFSSTTCEEMSSIWLATKHNIIKIIKIYAVSQKSIFRHLKSTLSSNTSAVLSSWKLQGDCRFLWDFNYPLKRISSRWFELLFTWYLKTRRLDLKQTWNVTRFRFKQI